jgi:hypothetical protein
VLLKIFDDEVHQEPLWMKLPVKKWKDITQNFRKIGWNNQEFVLQNGIILLKFFAYVRRNKELLRRLGGESTVEILCWRFKKRNVGMIICLIMKKQLIKHLQNMHLVCDSGR